VGLLNALAGLVLFLVFYRVIGVGYVLSGVLTFVTWSWFGYELQRKLGFKSEKSRGGFPKYLLTQLVFLVLSISLTVLLVEVLGLIPDIAYILALVSTTLGVFVVSKVFVFNGKVFGR
jgi:putative flippase GtrA